MFNMRFLGGAVAGAAAMYFLDPRQGRTRRAEGADKVRSVTSRRRTAAERRSEDAANRERGERLERAGAGRFHPTDDRSVAEHLHQVLGELDVATDDINVDVVGGVAALRGQVASSSDIDAVVRAVTGEPGVHRVESYLHLPGEPAPNKEAALRAGDRSA